VSLAAPTPRLHSPMRVLDQVARVSLDAPSPLRAQAIPCKSGLEMAFPASLSPYLQCSTYRSSHRELSLGGSTGSQGPWLSHLRPTTKGGPLR
jgi:hypothetical protein